MDMDINQNWTAEHDNDDDENRKTDEMLAYLHVSAFDFDSN